MKRIFIAVEIEPGATLLQLISALKTGLKNDNIKWVNTDNIHLTLSFLGDTEEEMIRSVSNMLKERCEGYGKFELVIEGLGIFRNLADPRVLWTGIKPSGELVRLNEVIKNGLKQTGTKIEDRPFNPHITLGRIKSVRDNILLASLLEKYHHSEMQRIFIDKVVLFESILLNTGPVYEPISIFKL